MTWNDHDHRGQYADDRHDHDDYAREHHRHYDLENDDEKASRRITGLQDEADGLRGQLADAFERIGVLEAANKRLAAALHLAAAGHEEVSTAGMADEPHLAIAAEFTEAFTAFAVALDGEPEPPRCAGTSDGEHCGDWHEGGRCSTCGLFGPAPGGEPEAAEYDPGPEIDDEGGMSEYRYVLPEDYERGQS